ncbi:hypothetical protein T01_1651 [Trichinella spiralis]|uniref:Uncharacterized protein n=1 Tax=Trichinella spiralis TaxID=6334 RepID=A0A0V1BMS6_TRISP|nr:hypothetical protein T01_1651 [Trichinella spiralis]
MIFPKTDHFCTIFPGFWKCKFPSFLVNSNCCQNYCFKMDRNANECLLRLLSNQFVSWNADYLLVLRMDF